GLAGYQVPRMAEVMRLLAGRAVGHLDVKETGRAAVIVARALEVLGPDGVIVTTESGAVAASLKRRFPTVAVGLTVGGDLAETAGVVGRRGPPPPPSRAAPARSAPRDPARGPPP